MTSSLDDLHKLAQLTAPDQVGGGVIQPFHFKEEGAWQEKGQGVEGGMAR